MTDTFSRDFKINAAVAAARMAVSFSQEPYTLPSTYPKPVLDFAKSLYDFSELGYGISLEWDTGSDFSNLNKSGADAVAGYIRYFRSNATLSYPAGTEFRIPFEMKRRGDQILFTGRSLLYSTGSPPEEAGGAQAYLGNYNLSDENGFSDFLNGIRALAVESYKGILIAKNREIQAKMANPAPQSPGRS